MAVSLDRSAFQLESRSAEFRGKSTDEKPVDGVPNGSTFYEFDTVKLYVFDADEKNWVEQ